MIWDVKMVVSSSVLLCVVIIQGTYGTIFPQVENSPPIPSPGVSRFLAQNNFNAPEDLPELIDERFPPPDAKANEEGWYGPERQSKEGEESFDDFNYETSEIGRVATPRPDIADESFQSSSTYRLSPTDISNADNPEIFILSRNSEGQYYPERWVQIPDGRVIEAVNPEAADTVKTFAAPVPFGIPPETQLQPRTGVNIVQIRPPIGPQKVFSNPPTIVENVPAVKQVVEIPPLQPPNVRKFVQRIISDVPPVAFPPPAPDQISVKKSFTVPPPPPPPLKGVDVPPNVISSIPVDIIPDSNVILSNKNVIPVTGKNTVQQVRHVWIPTSVNTGKFITIPISGSIKTEKSATNKGFSLESTPVTVSDTWVLKEDGTLPVFQQQKSPLPPIPSPIVQSGKVIFQNPTVVKVDVPSNPIVTRIESPKNAPIVEKSIVSNNARDIWPVRSDLNAKVLSNFSPVIPSGVPAAAVKSDTFIIEKPVNEFLPPPEKSIVTETKSAFPQPILSPKMQFINGKPCPFPLPTSQKSSFSPLNAGVLPLPRILSTQKRLPFARIIRVNRFPTGSYYLLNRNVRPSYLIYPNQAIIQQPKSGLISVIQTKQLPGYFQRSVPIPPVQTKQFSIPVQSKQFAPALPAKQVPYPLVSRQVILPVASPKSTRITVPTAQAIRYAYPWNAYVKPSPVINKGSYVPQFSPLKILPSGSESGSSEGSTSESSKEKKEEKSKKEKAKREKAKKEKAKKEKAEKEKEEKEKEEKEEEESKSNESIESKESEKESESESTSKSIETESEESSSPEQESQESTETSEV